MDNDGTANSGFHNEVKVSYQAKRIDINSCCCTGRNCDNINRLSNSSFKEVKTRNVIVAKLSTDMTGAQKLMMAN